ncbi:hypothetical protein acdb102_09020 [Acidothermaceae bacterium B102]|nr:hypothetical protein acdb102_09020 [Acidothermaceae bacterium B102]
MFARARILVVVTGLVAAGLNAAPTWSTAFAATTAPPLAGQWHMDAITQSGNQSVTPDSSGNGLDAQVVQVNQGLVAGRFGNALDLSAATAGVVQTSTSVPSPLAALEPTQVTVVAWVKHAGSPGQYKYVVAKGARACAAASYALYTGASGGLSFYVDGGSAPLVSPDAGTGLWDGQWHMVAGVFDGGAARLYVDGVQVGSGTNGSVAIDYGVADTRDFLFGNYPNATCGNTRWDGQLDEVRVYATGLSSADLLYLSSPSAVTPPTLPQPTPPKGLPALTAPPTIAGTATVGQSVSCSTGTWTGSPTSFVYQWQLDTQVLVGETSSSHAITAADVGHFLTCTVTATGAGGSTSATTAAVTPTAATTPVQAPSAVLKPVKPSAAAGLPILFDAGSSALHGETARSYTFTFSNGAKANCASGRPVLSAVFDAPVKGTVSLVVRTEAGASAAVSSGFTVGHQTASGRTVVGRARLASYACSATAATNPHARTSVGNLIRPCLVTSTVDGGFVQMVGCVGVVPISELSDADRATVPFKASAVRSFVPGSEGDPTSDVFYAAYDEVLINGLAVTPAKGHAVILAVAGGKGDTLLSTPNGYYIASADATVAVYAKGSRSMPLASGRISWDVSGGVGPNGAPPVNSTNAIPIANVTLANAAPIALPGIGWLLGKVISAIPGGNPVLSTLAFAYPADASDPTGKLGRYVTNVPIDLTNLPFGIADQTSQGATAALMLQTDNASGLQLGDFTLSIPDAFFGAVEIKDIVLAYSRTGTANLPDACVGDKITGKTIADSLTGCAKTDIASGTVAAKVVIGNIGSRPALKVFHVDYVGNLQVVPDIIYLTKFSGDLNTDTGTLVINTHLSILGGAVANGCGVAGAYGQMTIKSDPFSLDSKGNAEVLCIQTGGPGSFFHLDGHGYFSEGYYLNYDFGSIGSLKGNLSGEGYFAPSDGQYHMRLDGDVSLGGNAFGLGNFAESAHAVISDVGLAACTSIDTPWHSYDVGFGARYSPSDIFSSPGGALKYLADNFDFKGDGCDTNDYSRIPQVPAAQAIAGTATATADYGFTVPSGQKVTIVLLHGQDAAPGAILHGPGGQTIDVSEPGAQAAHKALVVQLASAKETEVQIVGATAGRWTVSPSPTAPAIAAVDVSSDLGKPAITAQVTGHGATRTLHYRLKNVPAGTKVAFVENGIRGGGLLGRTSAATGTLTFSPSAARSGTRTIVALLTAPDGTPRGSITVAHYSAKPPTPGKPSGLRVRHVGRTLVITFKPIASATKQVVSVRLSDGRGLAFVLGGRVRSLTVKGVTAKVHATSIAVRDFAHGLEGPALTGRGG